MLTRAGGSLYNIKPKSACREPDLSLSVLDAVPLSKIGTHLLASEMMMMTFITQGGEGRGKTNKKRKATKSEGRGLGEGASRALKRQVGEEGCGGRG